MASVTWQTTRSVASNIHLEEAVCRRSKWPNANLPRPHPTRTTSLAQHMLPSSFPGGALGCLSFRAGDAK